MKTLIKGGQVIDPGHMNTIADVLIEDGKIQAIDVNLHGTLQDPESVTIIDAQGFIVCPGFIDLHVHFREPGFEYKETIATGVASAVAGGFTTVCCMPNTSPVNDSQSITEFIFRQAKIADKARVFPIGAITKGSKGEELAEIGELHDAGCVAISDDGIPVMNTLVMRRAMEYARTFDLPVIDHCEDMLLSAGGSMNEGFVSTELGIPGIPNAAEEVMVARNIFLAELTQSRLHLPHVSTIGSVRLLRDAKERGLLVTAEACPHHFTLTDEAVRSFDTHAKMNPPLRTDADVQAIKEALKDGSIDIIATDHAPHAVHEKQRQFDNAPFGIIGLETALPLTLNLVEEGVLTMEQAVAKLTCEPARVFKLSYGTLAVGADADVTLFDSKKTWTLDPNRLHSKSRNTPFTGWTMKGKVVITLVGGRVVYEAE
ncbi:MAG: dihydroorotase [Nitrospirales bacterium]